MSRTILYDLIVDKRGQTGTQKLTLLQGPDTIYDSFEKVKS